MMHETFRRLMRVCAVTPLFAVSVLGAAEPERDGNWSYERNEKTGLSIQTMEMTLTPAAEPLPALKYRFIADDFDLINGSAAPFYLQAEGFIDRNPAREEVIKFIREQERLGREQGRDSSPPYSWLALAPRDLPQEEVKAFLKLHEHQVWYLAEAAKRKHFSMDRQIHLQDNPIAYLLPEIQQIREVARVQTLRCRLAIRENRIDDAITILGQQFATVRHLSEDPFVITQLVGAALVAVNSVDALQLVQHPQAPNLYWAFATLPDPLVNMRLSLGFEHGFLYEQFKPMQEVDETLRPAGYWEQFVDRLAPQVIPYGADLYPKVGWDQDVATARASLVGYIAASYPSAKRYLLEDRRLPADQVEAYPTAQVVFLAIRKFYDTASDDGLKWTYLPYPQAESNSNHQVEQKSLVEMRDKLGYAALFSTAFLGSYQNFSTASVRAEQRIKLLQTVEAIRLYGAKQGKAESGPAKLPPTLAELSLPAPADPATGKPFHYEHHGDFAVLELSPLSNVQWRLVLRFADPPSEAK